MRLPSLKAVCFLGYGIMIWTAFAECMCPEGFRLGRGSCFDIDECRDQNTCNPNAICRNLAGSYSCDCKEGFQSVGIEGKQCVDTDECHRTEPVCDRGETCQNEQGGFRCFCRGDVCHRDAYCNMDDKGIHCVCKSGYVGSGIYCEDVNECENGRHDCMPPTKCNNTIGGFECYRSSAVSLAMSYPFIIVTVFIFGHIWIF